VSTSSCALPAYLKDAVLIQTPYGAYLVNARGYGQVKYSAGTLTCSYIDLQTDKNLNLIPSTFCALDANSVYVMAGVTWQDENLKTVNETHMLNLTADTVTHDVTNCIVNFEMVYFGVPRLAMMFKDGTSNRIIGLLAGRLFQISTKLAGTIERYSAEGLSAMDLITNMCMIHNCMPVPSPDGILHIISRDIYEEAINVEVDIGSTREYVGNDFFFSQVNVSGAEDTIYDYTVSSVLGGSTFEIDSHPFITSTSQCRAVSDTYINFFGHPRKKITQEWIWTGGGIAPYETLQPFQKLTINDNTTEYYLISVNRSLKDYICTVILLEV
jgi:hypothetical protein